MNYIAYILKFVLRIKWWLILCPLIVALILYVKLRGGSNHYTASTTIYTGIVSGYDIESTGGARQDWNIINNAMDNLINIIQSQTTLKNVSMRLYAQGLVHADPTQDNQYLTARSSRALVNQTPPQVKALIDSSSEEQTLENLRQFETPDRSNHVYGMFQWTHPHYSYNALSRIKVKRISNSDMLEISYENNDPGIVYNTLVLINDEFVKQYRDLRFGETNNVIGYFESELERVGNTLRILEDSLRDYNIEHRVINYDEQTRNIAALSRDYELRYEEILLNLESSDKLRISIEKQIEGLQQIFRNNAAFINKLHSITNLYSRISAAEVFVTEGSPSDVDIPQSGSIGTSRESIPDLRNKLDKQTKDLQSITTDITTQQYTKEGISSQSMIAQWLDAVLLSEKSRAEMSVMKERKNVLDEKFVYYSPVGSTLKRKNRAIDFSERSYMALLSALNTARLRQKNLQMASATLKILNEPVFPIAAEPSKRKMIVIAAAGITFIFVLGFFILLELMDRTLRDKIRAERIIGHKVLASFPGVGRLSERRFTKSYREIASKYLGNAVLNYFHTGHPNIVNIISTGEGDGKSMILENLAAHYQETGMKVRVVSWNKDFDIEHKDFLLAERLDDFIKETPNEISFADADIILVEYPAFASSSVPKQLLQNASLNVLITPANRTWKETDQILFDKAVALADPAPIVICLNCARREVVEGFVGLLPPYTWLRRITYQISQFGFTAVK